VILRRRALLRSGAVSACAVLLAGCTGASGPGSTAVPHAAEPESTPTDVPMRAAPAGAGTLVILHTNDVMGYVDPCG